MVPTGITITYILLYFHLHVYVLMHIMRIHLKQYVTVVMRHILNKMGVCTPACVYLEVHNMTTLELGITERMGGGIQLLHKDNNVNTRITNRNTFSSKSAFTMPSPP